MKKTILFNITLFLTSLCFGQITLSKQDFEKLVDYANCKYVQAFIEKNDASKPYYRDSYLKNVKPIFDQINLDSFQSIPKFDKIKALLSDNDPALNLAKEINKRKLNYSEFQENDSLFQSLKASEWDNVDLSKIATVILTDIRQWYSSVKGKNNLNFPENDVVSAQAIQTTSRVEELQPKLDQLERQYENLKILLFIGLGVLLLLLFAVFIFFKKLTFREIIINYVLESKRVKELIITSSKLYRDTEANRLTEADLNLIVDRVLECQRLNESENLHEYSENLHEYKETKNKNAETSNKYKYLKGQNGKKFSRADSNSENSFFRLYNENDGFALFEFTGDNAEAIANRIFSDDVCIIIDGGYKNTRSVITTKAGKIKQIEGGWEVIEKVQVKLF